MNKIDLEVTDLNQDEVNEDVILVEDAPKKKKNNMMSNLLIIVGILCIGIALYGLYDSYKGYKEGQDIYNDAEEEFVHVNTPASEEPDSGTEEPDTSVSEAPVPETPAPEVPKGPWYERITVDMKGLQNKYKEVVGWLFFENEDISYPVLQGDDNEKYLTTAYNGAHSNVGSIFVDAANNGDFTDTHTILYGHTLHDNTMLSRLKYYMTKSGYYNNHQYFQIFCGDEILRYQVFSYQEVGIDSFIYRERFDSAKELSDRILQTSKVNPGLDIEDDDRIITFSTCVSDKAYRLVVSGVLVERYNITDKTLTEE